MSARFARIGLILKCFFQITSLVLNSKIIVYSYPTFNTYKYNVSNWYTVYHYILYISNQIYGQPTLFLWHNIQACVSIRIAWNGTISYENY